MKQKETQQETMSKEKRVVFFEGKSWYHRTKELQDDLTTKYGKKGGFETPEEAEKSYWEYEKRYQKKQRDLQIAKMQKTDVMLGDYLEYWFENSEYGSGYQIKVCFSRVFRCSTGTCRENLSFSGK